MISCSLARPPVCGHSTFSHSSRIFHRGITPNPSRIIFAAKKAPCHWRIARNAPIAGADIATATQHASPCCSAHDSQHPSLFVCILQRRRVHGHHDLLRAVLPHGYGTGVCRQSEFASRTRRMRGMSHRPRGRVVCALETFRFASGGRSHLSHLFAPNSFAGRSSTSSPRYVRALPLATAFLRRQAYR